MQTVAVDAMGSDRAPMPEVRGALAAVAQGVARVILVGDKVLLEKELTALGPIPRNLSVHHASEVITAADHPSVAVKSKRDASMRVAFDLVKRGDADAVISAGHSGAMLACGLFVFKRLGEVDRPAIVTCLPTLKQACALIDVGANVECKPHQLAQFALMGAAYSKARLGVERPRVGLLANGEESSKGTELTRQAHALISGPQMANAGFEYLGYVEAKELFAGLADVVVTDGFTGNILLKTAEGLGQLMFSLVKSELTQTLRSRVGGWLAQPALRQIAARVDYQEYGGAPLLGIDGMAIVCHGRSSEKAITSAIGVAAQFAACGLIAEVSRQMAQYAAVWSGSRN